MPNHRRPNSSVFAPPQRMPDWLGVIAMCNPVPSVDSERHAGAIRQPAGPRRRRVEQHAVLRAVAGPILVTAVFLPLAVRRYQRLSR